MRTVLVRVQPPQPTLSSLFPGNSQGSANYSLKRAGGQGCLEFLRKHPIYQDEGHPRWSVRAVFPSVVGAPLNHHITGLQVQFGVVQKKKYLTLEYDSVINGLRTVNERSRARSLL